MRRQPASVADHHTGEVHRVYSTFERHRRYSDHSVYAGEFYQYLSDYFAHLTASFLRAVIKVHVFVSLGGVHVDRRAEHGNGTR